MFGLFGYLPIVIKSKWQNVRQVGIQMGNKVYNEM